MQLGMDVSIQQTQKLALTPQMEQSLSVLQMGTEELNLSLIHISEPTRH